MGGTVSQTTKDFWKLKPEFSRFLTRRFEEFLKASKRNEIPFMLEKLVRLKLPISYRMAIRKKLRTIVRNFSCEDEMELQLDGYSENLERPVRTDFLGMNRTDGCVGSNSFLL